ncbi:MAG: DUF362 domain-containing protein [Bacillota bacterium]
MKDANGNEYGTLVAITHSGEDLATSLERAMDTLGGFEAFFDPADRILLKPNINGPLDAPASVDPEFLMAFIDLLRARGYENLAVAEASGRTWAPTEKVVAKKGLLPDLKRRDVPFYALDDMEWRATPLEGYPPSSGIPAWSAKTSRKRRGVTTAMPSYMPNISRS